MSHFYGTLNGQARTAATRRGSIKNPTSAHVRGWHSGVRVSAFVTAEGDDAFAVYQTGGSTGATSDKYLGAVISGRGFVPADERGA